MINSVLELTGVEASPVYCPRVDDVNGKGSWQGTSGENLYIIRALDAIYKTTSSDAVPVAFQDSIYWYDTGTTENGEIVYYDTADTYAYWYSGSVWLITVIADVGGSPTDYFLGIPETVTVSDAGTAGANGLYTYAGILNGKHYWVNGIWKVSYFLDKWLIFDSIGFLPEYLIFSTDYLPPKTGYVLGTGDAPAPTIEYGTPSFFDSFGSFSGTVNIEDSPDIWQITGSYKAIVEDTGTWPPGDFGDGVLTDLGQTITLDLQGGTGETTHYTFETVYGTFPIVTRFAYIFAGWFTAKEGTGDRKYADSALTDAEEDETLYANWINFQSGRVSNGKSMLSQFAIGVGTDLFAESITARKVRSEPVQVILPIPAKETDEA